MTKIFVSYALQDREFVQELGAALSQQQWDVCIDWQDNSPHLDWQTLKANIETADKVVFVISSDAIASQTCCHTIAHAVHAHRPLISIVVRKDFDPDRLYPTLRAHQWLLVQDQTGVQGVARSLVQMVEADLHPMIASDQSEVEGQTISESEVDYSPIDRHQKIVP
ncbi:MAG: toll/interleukin-1 receptor domain-containing protein [Leptolyngbyaceae cyanobacterium CSU_1_3]|nr:toll/interleukin-1 receptor domain-containing protein [Leptolyngbyaceae cyanobacterium CSU_1_3]